ncbi:MAG: TraB/GumN family protein [Oscillospiraceae bacterium]|nr:TraB/GumN family protein [Oscillospiraceae bacterium]
MKAKKLLALLIVFALMASTSIFAVFAAEDIYSPWAAWQGFMSESVYGLGNAGVYSDFTESFAEAKFLPVYESLKAKFGAGASLDFENKDAVTRGEIVSALYGIIAEVLGAAPGISPIGYFVENGLINGRASGDYQLDLICTAEEMIAFSVRVYEFLSYELGLDSKGLFWKITGEGLPNTVYLLGTIHAGDASIYPFSKIMLEAFDNSAYLGVEADIYTMSEEDMDYIIQTQMIQDGRTIRDFISEETYELYVEAAESFGIPPEIYDYIKPWAASNAIQNAMTTDESMENSVSAYLGIDMFFLAKAVNSGKPIVEVESIRYQIDMLDSFSNELQEMLLLSVIAPPSAEEGEEALSMEEMAEYARMVTAYLLEAVKTGDEAALTEMLMAGRDYEDPLMAEYNTKFWDIRDAAMAATIEIFLADEDAGGDFFVAVGAGHTVGVTGIAEVLKNKGYTVEFLGGG